MRSFTSAVIGVAGLMTVIAGAIGAGAGEVWAAVIAGVCLVGSVLLQSRLVNRSHDATTDAMREHSDFQAQAIERLSIRVDELVAANHALVLVIARLADASAAPDRD